jgi:hypothetical protein
MPVHPRQEVWLHVAIGERFHLPASIQSGVIAYEFACRRSHAELDCRDSVP